MRNIVFNNLLFCYYFVVLPYFVSLVILLTVFTPNILENKLKTVQANKDVLFFRQDSTRSFIQTF